MGFWSAEVKGGDEIDVKVDKGQLFYLSEARLLKNENGAKDSVRLFVKVGKKKLVLGTLHPERLSRQVYKLVFEKKITLSHSWKNGTVCFNGHIDIDVNTDIGSMSEGSGDDKDKEDEDVSEGEDTPKKVSGKKKLDESASKTSGTDKKGKWLLLIRRLGKKVGASKQAAPKMPAG